MVQEIINFVHGTLGHNILFSVGSLLFLGFFLGKLAAKVKLPEITGYIIAGLLLSSSVTGIINGEAEKALEVVTEVALGLIALSIGAEFSIQKLRHEGRNLLLIMIVQVMVTFLAVAAGLYIFSMNLPFALMLGAIATATAPAATVAIVQALKTNGTFVDYVYGVIALDDAGCIILFGIISALAFEIIGLNGGIRDTLMVIGSAFYKVFFSILIGVISGLILYLLTRTLEDDNKLLIVSVAVIFITIAVSVSFHVSLLLTNMTAGFVFVNFSSRTEQLAKIMGYTAPPILVLFFTIAGTKLHPEIILNEKVLLLGIAYIVFRAIGKYGGNYLGCLLSKVPSKTRNYLGFCMLPQAGVAIGLVLMIKSSPAIAAFIQKSPEQAQMITNMINIVLLSVFVNELIGPILSKWAIIRGSKKT